jgi:hypothetical protein
MYLGRRKEAGPTGPVDIVVAGIEYRWQLSNLGFCK